MKTPFYEPAADSPEPQGLGVAIRLQAPTFAGAEPALLFGAYRIDDAERRAVAHAALEHVVLIAIRRDLPGVFSAPARALSRTLAPRFAADDLPSPTFREVGYFNVELRAHLELPNEPGRYWVLASLLDYVTPLVSLELR